MSRKFSLYEYSRYAKTRHRGKCDGQTGYTMNILDAKVETIIRHIFDTMKEIPAGEAVNHSCEVKISELKARLKTANLEYEKAARSVEALDEELIKALQGESCFTQERLSRILDEKDAALREAKLHRDSIAAELADHEQQRRDSQKDYDQLLTWSSMYDQADREVKKMIAAHMIERVEVSRDYQIHLDFNFNLKQFNLGLEYGTEDLTTAI